MPDLRGGDHPRGSDLPYTPAPSEPPRRRVTFRPVSALSVAELQRDRLGLVAAGPPLTPKREWFEVPEPENPGDGAWTVTADGQVYGYAALWESCHTGKPGRCVKPPRSSSNYGYYMTGLTELEDGELIPTGRITLGTGHASLTASPAATAEHYDNTGAVAADVRIVDGKHGIWVSGALRPDVSPERARELRGASLSGDWRNIRGKLEMLGLLAVNVPGFPVPRTMIASGEAYEGHEEVLALVAAGVWEGTVLEPDITDEEWASALAELEDVLKDASPPVDPVEAALATLTAAKYDDGGGGTVKGEKEELVDAGWEVIEETDEFCVLRSPEGEERRIEYEATEDVVAAGPWDESKHPRHPAGRREGGRFAAKIAALGLGESVETPGGGATIFKTGIRGPGTYEIDYKLGSAGYAGTVEEAARKAASADANLARVEAEAERAKPPVGVQTTLSNIVDVEDGEEGAVVFMSKPAPGEISEYILKRPANYYGEKAATDTVKVTRRVAITPEEFDAFDRRPLDDRPQWFSNVPSTRKAGDGLYSHAPVVEVTDGTRTVWVDTQGYDYARYIAKPPPSPERRLLDDLLSSGDPMDLPVVAASRPFDASKHPRHPKGKREGGRFASKGDLTGMAVGETKTFGSTKVRKGSEKLFELTGPGGKVIATSPESAVEKVNAREQAVEGEARELIDRTEDGTPMREPAEERWLREEATAAEPGRASLHRDLPSYNRAVSNLSDEFEKFYEDRRSRGHNATDALDKAAEDLFNAVDLRTYFDEADLADVDLDELEEDLYDDIVARHGGGLSAAAPTPTRYALQGDSDGVDEGRRAKIEKVMSEFKAGKLKSSSGKKVTNRKQALAIAMSESEHLAAAALTASLRERLAIEGYATEDGAVVVRGRFDLPGAITAAGEDEAARRFVAEAAEEMGVVEELPATWDVDVLLARAGIGVGARYDESKHKRHPKGVREGGRFAPKAGGTSTTATEDDPSKGGKLIQGPGGRWMTRTEATMRMDQAEGRQPSPSLVNFEELPQGEETIRSHYSVGNKIQYDADSPLEEITEVFEEDGRPVLRTDASNEYRVNEDGTLSSLFEPPPDDSIASESTLIEGPGGRMMSRTEANELLDKERAGTPEQKRDRAAKRARESGRTEEARQYDRISHGEPATENERLAALSVEREALDTALQTGDRDGVRRAADRLSELMKAPTSPEIATQMLIPDAPAAKARAKARAANAPIVTSTSAQVAEYARAKAGSSAQKKLKAALAAKGIEGDVLEDLVMLEREKKTQ